MSSARAVRCSAWRIMHPMCCNTRRPHTHVPEGGGAQAWRARRAVHGGGGTAQAGGGWCCCGLNCIWPFAKRTTSCEQDLVNSNSAAAATRNKWTEEFETTHAAAAVHD
jgi:hypothetical protein